MKAQRGAAALPITLMLAVALLLAVGFANRSMVFEVRTAINQMHAAQAHEAAQAGLAWALAQLNRVTPMDDDCHPAPGRTAPTWREQAALATVEARCVASGDGWSCHCPASGGTLPARVDGTGFTVRVAPDAARPGQLQVTANGHSIDDGPTTRLQMRVGLLPGLDTVPAAALTVKGTASFDSGLLVVRHTDPSSGGLTVQAGGAIEGPALSLVSTPGTPPGASALSGDIALAGLSPASLHASLFRMDRSSWRAQPSVRALDCASACDATLAEAVERQGHRLLVLDGGLRLDAATRVGTAERPVLLVVDGPVELHARTVIHGLVYTRHSHWADDAGATVEGAVVAENDLQAQGYTQIRHDAAVLRLLQQHTGTYAPVAGSWRDL
ncbi:MAG: hypothetical protein KF891_02170 [Rhizobacter sp.]|nr:hypothetical protein [Rhizobacter sp.]